jgi:hypothetical protein
MTATETFDWSDYQSPSDFAEEFKFQTPGDAIAGTIVDIRAPDTRFGRKPVMTIRRDDGIERTVWCSNANLQSQLADKRPQKGDRIAIVFRELGEPKAGQSPPKLYDVELRQGGSTQAAAPAAPASTPAAADLL